MLASPTSGPAGSFIVNLSTTVGQPSFSATSGTINTQFSLPYITPGQCTTVSATGKVIGVACGSGAASIAVTSGSAGGFTGVVSSPTAVINFASSTFRVNLKGSATAFIELDPSSVTEQGNNLSATYLTNSSATATYLQLSSATFYLQISSAVANYFNKNSVIPVADGGTGTTSPGLIAGTNIISITGSWPNQTINASGTNLTGAILNQSTLQSGTTAYPEILKSVAFNTTETSATITGSGGLSVLGTSMLGTTNTGALTSTSLDINFAGSPTLNLYNTSGIGGPDGVIQDYENNFGPKVKRASIQFNSPSTGGIQFVYNSGGGDFNAFSIDPFHGYVFFTLPANLGSSLNVAGNSTLTTLTDTAFNTTSTSATVTGSAGLAVTAPGDGQITFTIKGSTYAVVSASTPVPAIGHLAVWTSTSGTLGDGGTGGGGGSGTPASPANSVQFNNSGSFGGSSNFEWSGTSVTIVSSVAISNAYGQGNTTLGLLDVFSNNAGAAGGQPLITIGSNQQANQITIADQQPLGLTRYGADVGQLNIGNVSPNAHVIWDADSVQSQINWWNGGEMDIQTATTGNGGKSIVFLPQNVEMLRLGGSGTTITSSVTVVSGIAGTYETTFGTAAISNVHISTNGFVSSFGPFPSVSSCGSTPNGSVIGDDKAGVITVGGTAPTACTLTFSMVHVGCTMVCNVTDNSLTISADISSLTTSALTLGFGVGGLAGGNVYYQCTGYGATCR